MFDFERLILVHSIHVNDRAGLKEGVKLHGHAKSTEHHVSVTVLRAKRLVAHFQTGRAVDGAINPGHLAKCEIDCPTVT